LARRLAAAHRLAGRERCVRGVRPLGRQLAAHAAFEFIRQRRMGIAVARKQLLPAGFGRASGVLVIPGRAQLRRHLERRRCPAEFLPGAGDLVDAQRLAVRRGGASLGRRPPTDDGLAVDQRRPRILGLCGADRARDRRIVQPVDGLHVPAIGLEAPGRVIGEPAAHLAVDRDAIVVVEHDQLAELERAGERAGLVRDAFHHAAVAGEHPGVVIDDRKSRAVELRRQQLLGQRETN